jgi:predicted HicB family RNase H-like nuclease
MNLRMPPTLHQRLTLEAQARGISLNQLINMKLASSY